jgi:hypothetical protein
METLKAIGGKVAEISRIVYAAIREWLSVPARFWATVLAVVFFFSAISYAIYPGKFSKVVFYFPSLSGDRVVAEERYIPYRSSGEAYGELLAKEIALGPITLFLAPVLPKGTQVETVMLREGTLFVDLAAEAALQGDLPLDIGRNLVLIKRSLMRNYPSLKKIVLTIGGYQPFDEGAAGFVENLQKKTKIVDK